MPLGLRDCTEPMTKAERAELKRENDLWRALEAENKRLRAALERIASEQKVYKGHGDFDTLPALEADEAQAEARRALTSASQ